MTDIVSDDIIEGEVQYDESTLDVSDNNIIKVVQRKKLAALLNNKVVSEDTMALMNSLTTVAIQNKRISNEEQAVENQGDIVSALKEMKLRGNPFSSQTSPQPSSPPVIDANALPEVELTDEMLEQGESSVTYEDIMQKPK